MKLNTLFSPLRCGKLRRTVAFLTMLIMVLTLCSPFAFAAGMEFFTAAIGVLQTLVVALGAGLGVWGIINLMEGYGNDNPGAKSQGMKQLMAGAGVALIGMVLVPQLSSLFTIP